MYSDAWKVFPQREFCKRMSKNSPASVKMLLNCRETPVLRRQNWGFRQSGFDWLRAGYGARFSQKRMIMVAVWARVALPWGTIVVPVTPWMMPFSMTQRMAVSAQLLTEAASVKAARLKLLAGSPAKRQSIVTNCSRVTCHLHPCRH